MVRLRLVTGYLGWLAFAVWLIPQVTSAHPISLSSAIVDVTPSEIRVELQIMLEDLVLYHGLQADGNLTYSASDLRVAAEKHQNFILEYFTILDGTGQRCSGSVEQLVIDQILNEVVPQTELMQRYIGLTVVYTLPGDQPNFLTFIQKFGGEESTLPAIMDLHVACNGRFQESAQVAFGRPHTVHLDWTVNPSTRRETLTELRERRKQQFQSRLGIASYSGLYSFIYITQFAVRHEILIPVLSLEPWVPIPRKNPDFLEVEEQAAVREAIKKFFQDQSRVTINDQQVQGIVERVSFFGLDINDFAMNADPSKVSMHQARLGVILNYPSPDSPSAVKVEWRSFAEHAPFIDSVVLVGNEKPARFYFHPKAAVFDWSGELPQPLLDPVPGNSLVTNEDQIRTLQVLLKNIYSAFDYREDGDVYDALAHSIQGDLLRDVYLRMKRSLLMAEHGGELAHAFHVEVTAVNPLPGAPGTFETCWQVASTSEHWGHIHTKHSEYRANLSVVRDAEGWKLSAFQLLDEKRLKFETSIRGYDSNR